MKIVYVVTSGYEENLIEGVFSTEEKAEEYIRKRNFFGQDNFNLVMPVQIDKLSSVVPKSIFVWGYIFKNKIEGISFEGCDEPSESIPLKFEKLPKEPNGFAFKGRIDVLPGESAKDFHKRAKEVVMSKFREEQ